jgi:hypothetical protein
LDVSGFHRPVLAGFRRSLQLQLIECLPFSYRLCSISRSDLFPTPVDLTWIYQLFVSYRRSLFSTKVPRFYRLVYRQFEVFQGDRYFPSGCLSHSEVVWISRFTFCRDLGSRKYGQTRSFGHSTLEDVRPLKGHSSLCT